MMFLLIALNIYFAFTLGISGAAKLNQLAWFESTLVRQGIWPKWSIPLTHRILPVGKIMMKKKHVLHIFKRNSNIPGVISTNKNKGIILVFVVMVIFFLFLTGCAPARTGSVSSNPVSGATSSTSANFQVYTNKKAGYSISIPADWTISTNDIGNAYFLNKEGLSQRSNGLTDWEASIAGIQIVGGNKQLDENAQYESILPNHCIIVDWSVIKFDNIAGRKYTFDCDNVATTGVQREEHVFIPRENRFIQLWLKPGFPNSQNIPSLETLISGLRFQ